MMNKLIPVICIAVVAAIFFGYINPTVTGAIATASQDSVKYESALAAAKRFEEKQTQLAAAQKALPVDAVERLNSFLPDGVDNVQLILDMDALASRSGMKLGDFKTTESGQSQVLPGGALNTETAAPAMVLDGSSGTDSLDISMTGTGSYAALRTFLNDVETSLRPLDLVEFQVSAGADGAYTYQMTYRLYWLR